MNTTARSISRSNSISLRNISFLLASTWIAASIACAPESPRLMSPPEKISATDIEAKPQIMTVTPKVDILMVIDNSDSMLDEQNDLSKNIDKFAYGLAKNTSIDFHIGAVSVWDTDRFKNLQKEYAHGELRRLKGPDGKNLPDSFGRFVSSKADYDSYLAKAGVDLSKEPGWLQVLRASLKIGVEAYKDGGPEKEEIFSPVKAALDSSAPTTNSGFRRDGAHLVIVFITDSDSTTNDIDASDLENFLAGQIGEKYRDEVTVLGALARKEDDPKQRDPQIRHKALGPTEPVKIQSFITAMGGKKMGLRGKGYGEGLAEFGSYVRTRALKKPALDLEGLPDWNSPIEVILNGEALVVGQSWQYDDKRNSIVITREMPDISGTVDLKVNYTAVTAGSLQGGRVHKLGQ